MTPPRPEPAAAATTTRNAENSGKSGAHDQRPQRKGKRAQHTKPHQHGTTPNDNTGNADDDEAVCFICADSVTFYAVGQCDHRTCFRCNLRLRELFKSKACPYCKSELDTIVYTRDSEAEFADVLQRQLPFEDQELGIKFDCKEAYDATKHALQFNCPHRKCNYVATDGWKDLKAHVRAEHALQFCDLCLQNKKSFAHEHKLFTKAQLRSHYARGDGTGFTGHPDCEFCRRSFYDNDQLFDHCRKKHEQCFICVRGGTGRQVYYANYQTLEEHFNSDHFSCRHPACLEKKFVVFENEIDLQSHDLAEHGQSIVGQRARREAKHVNVNFRYAQPGASSSRAARPTTMTVNEPDAAGVSIAGRRRPTGFGRVTNDTPSRRAAPRATPAEGTSTPEPSSPEPEPEAETLWPTLGSDTATSSGLPHSASGTRKLAPASFGRLSIEHRESAEPLAYAGLNPEVTAKHQELLQRVSAFLSHRDQPVERFRQLTTRYKNGQMNAGDYIQNCWLLFLTVPGKNAKEMIQKTIRSVSDLLPDAALKDSLLKALSEHRIKQQQFPALTPLIVSRNSAAADPSSRVLVIKPGAKGSARNLPPARAAASPASRAAVAPPRTEHIAPQVRRAPTTSALSESAFPLLGRGPAAPSNTSQAARISGQPAVASHNSYSAKFTHAANSPAARAATPVTAASEFPGLPPASVPRRKVIPLNPNATSAWESSLSAGSSNSNTGNTASKKHSRNAKGKQVLYYVG